MSKDDVTPAERFFAQRLEQGRGLTFKDVSVLTGRSSGNLEAIDFRGKVSRRVGCKVPLISSPMDTVTGSNMAIAMATCGGLGIIHGSLPPEEQAEEVRRVKRWLQGRVETPVTVFSDQTVSAVNAWRKEKGYPFHSFLVVDEEGRFVGMLTGVQFDLFADTNRTVGDVMKRRMDLITGEVGLTSEAAFDLMRQHQITTVPLLDSSEKPAGMYVLSDLLRLRDHQTLHNMDDHGQLMVGAAVSIHDAWDRIPLLVEAGVNLVVIDASHGFTDQMIDLVKSLTLEYRDLDVVGGNISTGEAAKALIEAGVAALRVGQGSGSICTTTRRTGGGRSLLTAIHDCAQAVKAAGYTAGEVPVWADGGVSESGDIVKAIGAGASCVMAGRIFAGTTETPGPVVEKDGKLYKTYRGMGSTGAMRDSAAARARYGQIGASKSQVLSEGVEDLVPYTGPVKDTFVQYQEGLRRGMGLMGATCLAEVSQKIRFEEITPAGRTESGPHDLPGFGR